MQFPASSMNNVAGLLVDSRCMSGLSSSPSLGKSHFGFEVLESLETDKWVLLSSEWEQYCCGTEGTAFVFSED